MATPTLAELADRVQRLEDQLAGVTVIRNGRPPIVTDACRKGNDPASCPNASVFQYQSGCRGLSCSNANAAYYVKQRAEASPKAKRAAKPASEGAAKPKRIPVKTAPATEPSDDTKPKRKRLSRPELRALKEQREREAALGQALADSDIGKAARKVGRKKSD